MVSNKQLTTLEKRENVKSTNTPSVQTVNTPTLTDPTLNNALQFNPSTNSWEPKKGSGYTIASKSDGGFRVESTKENFIAYDEPRQGHTLFRRQGSFSPITIDIRADGSIEKIQRWKKYTKYRSNSHYEISTYPEKTISIDTSGNVTNVSKKKVFYKGNKNKRGHIVDQAGFDRLSDKSFATAQQSRAQQQLLNLPKGSIYSQPDRDWETICPRLFLLPL